MSTPATPMPDRPGRLAAAAAGAALLAIPPGLALIGGLEVLFQKPFQRSSQGELLLWLCLSQCLLPGCCLLGWALAPVAGPALRRLAASLAGLRRSELRLGLLLVYVIGVAVAGAGHALVLQGYPITDDEYAIRFGGQVLASGHLAVPLPLPADLIPLSFLLLRRGLLTSMDFPGGQLFWALSEWAHLGALPFHLLAGLPAACLAWLAHRRLGPAWGALAAALLLLSPMALALSYTAHAHVLSRGLLALGLALLLRADDTQTLASFAWAGLALGLAALCRPPEVVCLATPLCLGICLSALRRGGPGALRPLAGLLLGAAPAALVLLCVNHGVTGSALLLPRMAPEAAVTGFPARPVLYRAAANSGYNLLLLTVWFLGPVGLPLAVYGAWRDRTTRLLAAGVVATLALALLHDDIGVHAVGPIHYSESVVPLTLLAVHGLARARERLSGLKLPAAAPASALALYLVLGLGFFSAVHGQALREQSEIQSTIYGGIDELLAAASPEGADRDAPKVVLAPSFGDVWKTIPSFYNVGTWVFHWRRPRPDLSDKVLILHDAPGVRPEDLRRALPGRRLFRLTTLSRPPFLRLESLTP